MQHEKTVSHLSQKRFLQIAKASLAAALLGIVGCVDLVTGYEISIFPLYALPISVAAWFFGLWAGIAAAGAAVSVWAWADIAAGHVYAKPWIIYVNAGSRLVFFLLVALAAGYIVTTLRRPRSQSRLVSETQPVCTGCGKVRDRDGYWWDFRGYVRAYCGAVTQPKLCPDCAHEAYAAEEESAAPISR